MQDRQDEITIRKYNPGTQQTDAELIQQFVVRKQPLETIMQIVHHNLGSKKNQHILIVGARGRGKTMLLMRIAAEIRTTIRLSEQLLPVPFMEESHEILTMADFWLECLFHLANALKTSTSPSDNALVEALLTSRENLYQISDDKLLEQQAKAAVLDISQKTSKRLLLMIENLQDLSEDADDEFAGQLQHMLLEEPAIMLLASATSRFGQMTHSEAPFYKLFKDIELAALNTAQCQTLWNSLTAQKDQRNVRPLEILTGGSPRLLVIIAGFANHRSMHQLIEDLVVLVDEHTEYFRSHLEAIAPKERKVYLALIDLWGPSSTKEVAHRARMEMRTVSSLLGRLVHKGLVIEDSPGEGKKGKLYSTAERLYCIYYKLRRERNQASVIYGLLHFMAVFYSQQQWSELCQSVVRETGLDYPLDSDFQPKANPGINIIQSREPLLDQLSTTQFQTLFTDVIDQTDWQHSPLKPVLQAIDANKFELALTLTDNLLANPHDTADGLIDVNLKLLQAACYARDGLEQQAIDCYQAIIEQCADSKRQPIQEKVAFAWLAQCIVLHSIQRADKSKRLTLKLLEKNEQNLIFMVASIKKILEAASVKAVIPTLLFLLESVQQQWPGYLAIVTALKQELGETVMASQEQLEVAEDVRKIIAGLREKKQVEYSTHNLMMPQPVKTGPDVTGPASA